MWYVSGKLKCYPTEYHHITEHSGLSQKAILTLCWVVGYAHPINALLSVYSKYYETMSMGAVVVWAENLPCMD